MACDYYGDILVPDFWYRAAQEFRDPEFLWAAAQTSIGPEPPIGEDQDEMRRQWKNAYARRFAWFIEHGIEPKPPETGSSDWSSKSNHLSYQRTTLTCAQEGNRINHLPPSTCLIATTNTCIVSVMPWGGCTNIVC